MRCPQIGQIIRHSNHANKVSRPGRHRSTRVASGPASQRAPIANYSVPSQCPSTRFLPDHAISEYLRFGNVEMHT
jgi:hypothetical protein